MKFEAVLLWLAFILNCSCSEIRSASNFIVNENSNESTYTSIGLIELTDIDLSPANNEHLPEFSNRSNIKNTNAKALNCCNRCFDAIGIFCNLVLFVFNLAHLD